METYVASKSFVEDPDYEIARTKALNDLDLAVIDTPILDIIDDFSRIPHCFTMQSCWGHFVHDGQPDPRGCAPLADCDDKTEIRFQLAYVAVCLENSEHGKALRNDLRGLVEIDPSNVQFGSAEWFWKQRVNSYVLQVEPDRFKYQDRAMIGVEEAFRLEQLKARVFDEIRLIVSAHCRNR
jgi:hypothetical protein